MKFTETQITALAPDDASLKAGKSLSGKNNWLNASHNERVLWGEIKGSGSKPYQTQVDLNNIAFKCSCPSRKFPCKHGLGLLLLSAKEPSFIQHIEDEPAWVKDWIDKRTAKAEKATEVIEATPQDIEKSEKSKQKRADERQLLVESGIAELSIWVKDIVRTGILGLASKEKSYFDKMAARMVDSKAPGLAGWVKSLSKINYLQDGDA